ncbi:MAG: phosphotransferase [Candidatus Saccharibacteria bacterium]|nr:phosphotransferase [Candidatus Saccharibacteria bacterium]
MSLATRETIETKLVDSVCRLYGLTPTTYTIPNKGYRNRSYGFIAGKEHYNLLLYKREARALELIKRANSVGDTLANSRFPARQTVDGRIIRVGNRLACLYQYIPGVTIPWEAYTRRHLTELGSTMAQMHHLLSKTSLILPAVEDVLKAQLAEMSVYFNQPGVLRALQIKLRLALTTKDLVGYAVTIDELKTLSGRQPLHMDYVRGNILFDESAAAPTITGVIDFEKAAMGHPLVDAARTLAFLAVDCKYQTPARAQRYFLHTGYLNNAADLENEMSTNLFTQVINLFLLHDFYKFLLHNPYEALNENHHFRRTAALLVQKRLLRLL